MVKSATWIYAVEVSLEGMFRVLPYLILFLFFITGAVGLAFEVLWIRMLVNIFGTTVYAVSTVISSFFAGLALGSHFFGKIAEKSRNPLRFYGALEFSVGISALFTLFILTRMDVIWASIYSLVGANSLLYAFVRFGLCFLILLVPTTLMGGTLPVLSKYFVRSMRNVGWSLGLIYSVNTFGALVGCFLVGFVLIRAVGIRNTLYAGVACNMFVALTAFVLGAKETEQVLVETDNEAEALPESKGGGAPYSKAVMFVPAAFAVSGFASLSYELLWTRILVYFIGVQTYAYTIMLMVFLFGIAMGSIVFARISDAAKDNLFLFGIVEILIGLFSIIGLFTLGHLSSVSDYFMRAGFIKTWWHYAGLKFILSAVFMLVPTLLIGSTFPLVARIFVDSLSRVSNRVGQIYALNTVGGIFGSVLTGFVFLPLLGLRSSVLLIVSINVILGLVLVIASTRRKSLSGFAANMLGALIFVPVAYFAAVQRPILADWNVQKKGSTYEILHCKEGIECTLSVLLNKRTNGRELNINGQSTAYTSYRDIEVHKMLVHVPMLMHPSPHDVLIIGFGMGCTSYESTLYEGAKVSCVELVKDEIETAEYFEDLNKNVLANPKFTFVHDDGRNYIQLKNNSYDMISFNAIHPRLSPGLYTKDFYEICRRRMKPDSVICAWLPTNWITPEEFRALVKTFISVFPESTMWYCNPDHIVLVGGLKKPEIDFDAFTRRIEQPSISEHLRVSNLDNPFSLLGALVLGPEGLDAFAGTASVVTDDRSQIEFSKCLDYGLNDFVWSPILEVREHRLGELMEIIRTSNEEDRRTLHKSLRSLPPFIRGQILSDPKYNRHKEALEEYERALSLAPENANIAYWRAISQFQMDLQK